MFQYAKQAEMKELFATVADGQIETYRKVSNSLSIAVQVMPNMHGRIRLGHGRVGKDYPHHATYSCGCVGRLSMILIFHFLLIQINDGPMLLLPREY